MSSTSAPSSSLPIAPWKTAFESHLSKMPSPQFVLSTVAAAPKGSPVPYVPRARYVIFRGFWGTLPENKHNDAPKNPRVYESELPVITTDVRMQKVSELFGTSAGHAESEEQIKGSGGGGPVEAVWWVEETQTQWRIKGNAYIVSKHDIEKSEDSGTRTVKSKIGERMRIVDESKQGEWSWEREVIGHFGNNSPGIRGSFKAPPPGRQVFKPYDDKKLKLGEKVDTLDDDVALSNFRLVIIRPDEVEQTDLSDPGNSRRYLYTINEDHKWNTEELWP